MALYLLLLIGALCIAGVYPQCMPIDVCMESGASAAIQKAQENCGSTELTDDFKLIKKPLEELSIDIKEGDEACRNVMNNQIDSYVEAVFKECIKPHKQFYQSFLEDLTVSYKELMKHSERDVEHYCPPLEKYLNSYYSLFWSNIYILEQCKVDEIIQNLYRGPWEQCLENVE